MALKNRSLLKTLAIALGMMLCILLGPTAIGINDACDDTDMDKLIVQIYSAVMLGILVFIIAF